jgi:hypothetical protein
MNNGRQVYFALTQYANAYENKFPASLSELVPEYIPRSMAQKLLSDPEHPEAGENAWLYYGAGVAPKQVDNPSTEVLLASKFERHGKRVVVHFDGSVAKEPFLPPAQSVH